MDQPETDLDILRKITSGNAEALGELASRYEAGLLGLAASLLHGRRDLATDAVQDCWLRVLRSAGQFEGRSGVKAWLYRILINRCHDLREKATLTSGIPTSNAPFALESPPETLESIERLASLRRAVELLSPDHRLLVLLCYHAGMTHEHAAEVLGVPLGTLKSRLNAALTSLRGRLSAATKGGRS